MFKLEYKTHCINCKKEFGQIQAKRENIFDCKNCGFYFVLKSDSLDISTDHFWLEIYLSEKPEYTLWNNRDNSEFILSCPFCVKKMFLHTDPNLTNDKVYKCEECHRVFSVDYL